MSTPESPIPIDAPAGATALRLGDDGPIVYRAEQSAGGHPGWTEVRSADRIALESITLGDAAIEPPVYGEFRVSTDVDAPVTEVFEYIADVRTHPEYADFVDDVEILSAATVSEGVVFVQTHEGSTERIETEVTVYEPTESVGWVTRKEAGDIHIRYWFEGVDTGTRVIHAGIAPIDHGSAAAFERDRAELRERYENNVTELSNLRARFA